MTQIIERDNINYVRCFEDDKKFFIGNDELEKYLSFKYKELIRKQEDLMFLIRKELESNMNSRAK